MLKREAINSVKINQFFMSLVLSMVTMQKNILMNCIPSSKSGKSSNTLRFMKYVKTARTAGQRAVTVMAKAV